jgi:hypothetical protein
MQDQNVEFRVFYRMNVIFENEKLEFNEQNRDLKKYYKDLENGIDQFAKPWKPPKKPWEKVEKAETKGRQMR